MTSDARTVCVVDDEPAVSKALSRMLSAAGYDAVCFTGAHSFLEFLESHEPACAVLDILMPELTGFDVQQLLAQRHRECSVVFLSGNVDVPMSVRAMKAGAIDVLTKPVVDEALLGAVSVALEQHASAMEQRTEIESLRLRWSTLTTRERQVFRRVVGGKLNKQIAAELGTGEKTVKVHRQRVMLKMHAKRITDLVRMADRLSQPVQQ